jgi:hypothetical protein
VKQHTSAGGRRPATESHPSILRSVESGNKTNTMARRNVALSLFPFLSVLLCAMGVFVVVITGQNALSIGGGELTQVIEIGAGTSEGKRAVFGECQADGLMLQPEERFIPLEEIESALREPGLTDNSWTQFLSAVEVDKQERYLVLLVRAEGVEVFELCHYLAQQRGIDVGKDVVPSRGPLLFTENGRPIVSREAEED